MRVFFCAIYGFVSDPDTGMANECPACGRKGIEYLDGELTEIIDRVSEVRRKLKYSPRKDEMKSKVKYITEWKAGDKAKFTHPDYGSDHDMRQAGQYLRLNKLYTLESIEVGSFHSEVGLKEIPDQNFNSVHFDVKEKP